MSERRAKVEELIKQELSQMILSEVKDPRVGFVTVTGVKMTPDLREGRVYISVMGDEKKAKDSMAGLKSAMPFFKRELGKRIRLRYMPALTFELDKSLDYGEHIQKLLLQVERGEEN